MSLMLTVYRPGWLKRMFTDIVTFTVKLVVKSQVRGFCVVLLLPSAAVKRYHC